MVIAVTSTMIAAYDHDNHQFIPLPLSDIATRELYDAVALIRQALTDDLGILLYKTSPTPI